MKWLVLKIKLGFVCHLFIHILHVCFCLFYITHFQLDCIKSYLCGEDRLRYSIRRTHTSSPIPYDVCTTHTHHCTHAQSTTSVTLYWRILYCFNIKFGGIFIAKYLFWHFKVDVLIGICSCFLLLYFIDYFTAWHFGNICRYEQILESFT